MAKATRNVGQKVGVASWPFVPGAMEVLIDDSGDPSLEEGHTVVYDSECPVELRFQESPSAPQEMGTVESVRFRVLARGEGTGSAHVRVELTSDSDLFFHYFHAVNHGSFNELQEQQKILSSFDDYPSLIGKMVNSCVKDPQSFLAVFIMDRNGEARLDFVQNLEYKFVELLSLEFLHTPEDSIRRCISFRHNLIKSQLCFMQARLQDVNAILRVKNPSLLMQLQKASQARISAGAGRNNPWLR
eukprot:Lankesteria_metandrocarpae@DN3157_c0_g1_i1.p1